MGYVKFGRAARGAAAFIGLGVLLGGCATDEYVLDAPTPAPGFTYSRKPTPDDLRRAYPAAARDQEIEGYSVLRCHLQANGYFRDCVVEQESPAGHGFGAGALALVPKFRIARNDPNATIYETVRVPIRWQLH